MFRKRGDSLAGERHAGGTANLDGMLGRQRRNNLMS